MSDGSVATDSADADKGNAANARADSLPVPGVGHRWRRALVIILAILTCTSILTSTIGVWAHRTLLNTDSWVNAVGPLASDPQITNALAVQLTDELMQVINADQVAQNALPAQAKFLAAPLTEGVQQFVQKIVEDLLNTQQFATFWVDANRRLHTAAVKVLRGDTTRVSTSNGTVQIDLLPLITDALNVVQQKAPGLLGDGTKIPDITSGTPIDQARSELSAAIGRPLPDNFGTVTVFQSNKLKAAQDAVAMFDRLVIAMLVLTVLLLIATIALALNRRRIVIGLAVGMIVALVIASAIISSIKTQALDLISSPDARGAADATISTLVSRLQIMTNGLVAVGVAVALIAFLTGPSRPAVAIRTWASRVTRFLAGKIDHDGPPASMIWIQRNVNVLRWGGLLVGLGLLLFVVSGWWSLFFTVLVVGLYEAAISYAAAREPVSAAPVS